MSDTTTLTDWLDLCALSDVPLLGARRTTIKGNKIGVFRTDENTVYAIDNTCPHKQGPLSEGIVHDCAVTCPLHNWVIDLQTGEARGADEGKVATYPVEIREGRIFIQVKD